MVRAQCGARRSTARMATGPRGAGGNNVRSPARLHSGHVGLRLFCHLGSVLTAYRVLPLLDAQCSGECARVPHPCRVLASHFVAFPDWILSRRRLSRRNENRRELVSARSGERDWAFGRRARPRHRLSPPAEEPWTQRRLGDCHSRGYSDRCLRRSRDARTRRWAASFGGERRSIRGRSRRSFGRGPSAHPLSDISGTCGSSMRFGRSFP